MLTEITAEVCGGGASLAPAASANGWMTRGEVKDHSLLNDVIVCLLVMLCGYFMWGKVKATVAAANGTGHSYETGKKLLGGNKE